MDLCDIIVVIISNRASLLSRSLTLDIPLQTTRTRARSFVAPRRLAKACRTRSSYGWAHARSVARSRYWSISAVVAVRGAKRVSTITPIHAIRQQTAFCFLLFATYCHLTVEDDFTLGMGNRYYCCTMKQAWTNENECNTRTRERYSRPERTNL